MLQGLYAAASGMEADQSQFTAISNDMANLNTPGYQGSQIGFEDLLYSGAGSASGTNLPTGTGAAAAVIGRDHTEGSLQQTGNPLDVAINGEGYLQVRRSNGTVGLTRNGTLQLDSRRQITDAQGDPLVPSITVPPGVSPSNLKIAANGTVTAGRQTLGRIQIVTVPAPNQLQPDGTSLFSVTAGSGAARPATGSTLTQGAVEGSNVDIGQAMSDMINTENSYQMAGQAIQYQDQMLQIANQLKSS